MNILSALNGFLHRIISRIRTCLWVLCSLLPILSLSFAPLYTFPRLGFAHTQTNNLHLVLSLDDNELQLHNRAGELLFSQSQVQRVIINHPDVKSLTLDFRQGLFDIPVEYQGNAQQNAQLIIQGGAFPLLEHTLKSPDTGLLDFDQDGQADVSYSRVTEIHLSDDSFNEARLIAPFPYAEMRYQFMFGTGKKRIASGAEMPEFATTIIPSNKNITWLSPAEHR